jgi:hypothetical protein
VPTVDVQLWRIMQPLDLLVDYGITERSWLDIEDVQLELLPDKVHELRQKLNQYDEMSTGEPDAGNPHVRFDEGCRRERHCIATAARRAYSTGSYFLS